MTPTKPKPKRVRCWMIVWPSSKHFAFSGTKTAANRSAKLFGGTITPGHFVPDESKKGKSNGKAN